MPGLLDLLGDPLSNLTKGIGDIIGKFITDPNQKLQASLETAKLQEQFQEKMLEADVAFANAQRDTIVAEAKSESWMARNWRPMIMLMFGYIIFHNFIIAQLFSLKTLPVPDDLWALMKLGIGGYVIGRSAEKIIPETAKIVVASKKDSGEAG